MMRPSLSVVLGAALCFVVGEARAAAPQVLWQASNSACAFAFPLLGDDGILYLTMGSCSDYKIRGMTAVDPSDGTILWGPMTTHPRCTAENPTASMSLDGTLYQVADWNECGDGYLTARDSSNGQILWYRGTSGVGYSPHPRQMAPSIDEDAGAVYFGSSHLFSVDMLTGQVLWNRSGGHYIGGQGMAIDSGGGVAYGTVSSPGGRIRSYTSTGVFRWSRNFSLQNWDRARIEAVIDGDVMLIYHQDADSLLAVPAGTGSNLWTAPHLRLPVVDEAGHIYAASTVTSEIVALNADGSERWRANIGSDEAPQLDFVDRSGRVYARAGHALYAIETVDGSVAWTWVGAAPLSVGLNLVPGGRLFVVDGAGTFTVLDTALDYSHSAWPMARFGNRRHTGRVHDVHGLPGADPADPPVDPPADPPDDSLVCEDLEAAVEDAWEGGYSEGLSTGYDLGYSEGSDHGYTQGYSEGSDDGYSLGYSEGSDHGYTLGYSEGSDAGYTQGYSEGNLAGYTQGYSEGYQQGSDDGYASGYSDGHTAGHSAGYSVGFDDGNAAGYSEGYDDGHADGFEAGREACVADPASCGIVVNPGFGATPPGLGGTAPGQSKRN